MFNSTFKGANVTSDQSSYDLLFKDVIINRSTQFDLPVFTVPLNQEYNNLYKAELIAGTISFGKTTLQDLSNNLPLSIQNSLPP